jgi:hypothetical protein
VAKRNLTRAQIRNLAQYKGLSDDEFDKMWEERDPISEDEEASFEKRIENKIEEFSKDYDLDDLKINDREALRSLIKAIITLDDYEKYMYAMRTEESITQGNVMVLDRVSKMASDLRRDISVLEQDLNIKRRVRKSDKEASVVNYLADLKTKARRFYESRSSYVFCPDCNMLLGTVWTLYPESENTFTFTCQRPLDEGKVCGCKFTVTSAELLKTKGTSNPDITPDGML